MKKGKKVTKNPAKQASAAKKKTVVAEKVKTAKPNNSALITVVSVIVALIIVAEIYFALQNQVTMSKKPVLAAEWKPEYRGQIGTPVSGKHMYIIDNNANQVKKYEKLTGKLIDVYDVESTPKNAAETSAGDSIIVLQGSGALLRYTGSKLAGKIELSDVKDPSGIAIDSTDNIYVGDGQSCKIYKYSLDGIKLLEFGGKGPEASRFTSLGKIFIDAADNIYAFDSAGVAMTKVFDSKGKFLRKFLMPIKRIGGLESIAVTPDGNIYFNDMAENQILVMNPRGKVIGKFNMDAASRYKIGSPGALSGGPDGYVYVCSYSAAVFEPIKY